MEGYSCSQSVVMAFAPRYGVDEKTARLMSAGFGGGVGRLRMLCGAVSGAVMIAGLATGGDGGDNIRLSKAASYKGVQEIVGAFREENGSVICAELLGMKTTPLSSTSAMSYMPAERDTAYYAARPCAAKVESAARILARFIAAREAK
ncbi:MAG: C-GCAxxG-C-C family protein [Prevotella sp.]